MLFDITSGEVLALKGKHSGKVNGATWGKDTKTVFTCSDDKHICKWNLSKKSQGKKWRADSHAITRLAYLSQAAAAAGAGGSSGRAGGGVDLLISAGLQIKIWDAEELVELRTLRGHAFSIGSLVRSADGLNVVSCAHGESDDPLIYMWSAHGEDAAAGPAISLLPKTAPVDVAEASVDGGDSRVLAVTTAGVLHIFDAEEEDDSAPCNPTSTISLVTGDIPSSSVDILSATFSPGKAGSHVLVARGVAAAPVFEHIMYTSEETGEPIDLTLTRQGGSGMLLGSGGSSSGGGGRRSGAGAAEATIMGASDGLKTSSAKRKKSKQAAAGDEPSLEDQVQAMAVATGGAGSALPSVGAPRAGSLAHMLAQALHSNDKALLEECLNNTNEGVVRNTVMRLPPTLAVRFLTDVVGRLEAKPSRGVTLMVWIRAVLLIHSSYLMTVPDLPNILSGLYNLIDARLAVFPRLLKLSGRLDLLLSQIALKSQAAPGGDAAELNVPITSFVDEESDLEDDDEENDDENGGTNAHGWEDEDDDGMSDSDMDDDDDDDDGENDDEEEDDEDDDAMNQ